MPSQLEPLGYLGIGEALGLEFDNLGLELGLPWLFTWKKLQSAPDSGSLALAVSLS